MTAPVPYERLKNFTQFALDHTADPYNASDHDAELNAIAQTLMGVLFNRALIQRDDGALANDSVHPDALSTATLLLIEAAGSSTGLAGQVRGLWHTATVYEPGQIVQNATTSYLCAVSHTSGVFATDYAAGDWIILGETAAAGASVISFTPAGNIEATNVQAAIQELDGEKAAKAGLATQSFSVGDATAATQAASMGQIQNNTLRSAIGAGTADAMLATIASGLTVLVDGMEFTVESPGTNTLTAPTLALTLGTTPTGAKGVVKGAGVPLIAGDIAGNKCKFIYDLSLDKWVLLNPLYAVGLSASLSSAGGVKNLGLAFSVGANALSASIVTATGSLPTSGSPIEAAMRSPNVALGTFNIRTITAPMGLIISAGSTLGHSNGIAAKINWYLIDNAGVLELAASSYYFGKAGIASTTAEGGAGGAGSGAVMYSATARAGVPFIWIGETTDTQITAGSWLSGPSAATLVGGIASAFMQTVLVGADAAAAKLALMVESAIFPITASAAGNALTITLNPCVISFRSPSLDSGAVNTRVVSSPISTVISSGSTGGTTNGALARLVIFAMDVNGVVELGWLNGVGQNQFSSPIVTTLAEGGAGAADLAGNLYSTTARTNVPWRILGDINITQATAGTWVNQPSAINGLALRLLPGMMGLGGDGYAWQNVAGSRAIGTTYTNTSGRPIMVCVAASVGTQNSSLTITINGAGVSTSGGAYFANAGVSISGVVVPNGATYSVTLVGGGTSSLGYWTELR
jgi:hypothetical protein